MWNSIKSVASKVWSGVKSGLSSVKPSNLVGSVINASGRSTLPDQSSTAPRTTTQLTQSATRDISGKTVSGGTTGSSPVNQPAVPAGFYPQPQRTLGGGATSSSVDNSFFQPTGTKTISSDTFGTSALSAGQFGGATNAGSMSMPSVPVNRNTGAITNAGLATADTKINPDTGMFDTQGDLQVENKEDDVAKAIRELSEIPKQESYFDDPRRQEAQAEVNRQKQELNNWQGQLNNIVAKQQQDLMRHEKEISMAGGTVEGFSGRAAAINREAAYAALPIQAQVAIAQGNLGLAQDYLKDLTSMVKEEIDNNYTYKVAQYNAVKEIADKREKRILDELEKSETRAYNESKNNLGLVDDWMQEAVKNKQPNLVNRLSKLNIHSPNFRQDLAGILGQMKEPVKASGGGGSTGNNESGLSGVSSRTEQVLDGFVKISELTPSEAQKVRDDLYSNGFGSDTPPEWFREYLEERNKLNLQGASIAQDRLKTEWKKYREGVLGGSSTSSSSSASSASNTGFNFDDY